MADIYYYMKSDDVKDVLSYGLKLSEEFLGQKMIRGFEKKYMIGLLNPRDDMEKYESIEYTCIRMKICLLVLSIVCQVLFQYRSIC